MSHEFRLPLVLDGRAVTALVVGGGAVAARKVRGLLDAGASVRVVSPDIHPELSELARREPRLELTRAEYSAVEIDDAMLVIAATDQRAVNAAVARDAQARSRLVNVVDAPEEGNCVTPAVHRAGPLLVAVTAGGVPRAAARVRDEIAERFDGRYAAAVAELCVLRRRLLAGDDRARWPEASRQLVGDDFCQSIEQGTLLERMAAWR